MLNFLQPVESKQLKMIIMGGVMMTIVIVGVGVILGAKYFIAPVSQTVTTTVSTKTSVTPTTEIDQFANWQALTYTPTKTGLFGIPFTVKLPQGMNNFQCENNGCWVIGTQMPSGTRISLITSVWSPDLKWSDLKSLPAKKNISYTLTQINGRDAIKTSASMRDFGPFSDPAAVEKPVPGVVIHLDGEKWVSIFAYKYDSQIQGVDLSSEELATFNQILSTFQFTQ